MPSRLQSPLVDTHSHLSSEIQLLLCSGHLPHDGTVDTTSQLRIKAILANDINWDYLIEIALYHKMLPLLCQTLSNICDDSIPASVMSQLHEMATHIAMRNMALAQELLRLLELLQNHNIDALTFKGPALTSLLYGNLILSESCAADTYLGERTTFGGSIELCTVSELVRDVEDAGWKIQSIQNRRFYSLRTIALWQQNLDRVYGDREPPGQLGVLRSLVNAALPSPVTWCQSFPLIDIVAD